MTTPNILAIASRKGGVAKSTTAVSIASVLAERGLRVLLIDLDPQGHATLMAGLAGPAPQGAHLLITLPAPVLLSELVRRSAYGFDMLTGGDDMLKADEHMRSNRLEQYRLREALEQATNYDVVIIDCPGNFGDLAAAGLIAAAHVLVPCTLDALGLDGLGKLDTVVRQMVRLGVNPKLRIAGVLEARVNMRSSNAQAMHAQLAQHAGGLLLTATIRETSYFPGATAAAMPITSYLPKSEGAHDYRRAVDELVQRGVL